MITEGKTSQEIKPKIHAALLMKNNINQKAVSAMGHAKSIITIDTYTDIRAIIKDCETEIQKFIREVHRYRFL